MHPTTTPKRRPPRRTGADLRETLYGYAPRPGTIRPTPTTR